MSVQNSPQNNASEMDTKQETDASHENDIETEKLTLTSNDAVLPPDGATLPPDGATLPPDGATMPPDGTELSPDGAALSPDGATLPPDEDTLPPDGATLPSGAAPLSPDEDTLPPDGVYDEVVPSKQESQENEVSGTESSIQVAEIFPQIQSLIKSQSSLDDSLEETAPSEPQTTPDKASSPPDGSGGKGKAAKGEKGEKGGEKGVKKRKSRKPQPRKAKKPLPNAADMRTVPAINTEVPWTRGFAKRPRGICEACETEEGMYRYGAILCPYCWWFYYKTSHRAAKLRCADLWCKDENGMCDFVKLGIKCPYCRMQKMFAMGIRLPDFLPHTGFCRACNGKPCGKHYGNFVCKECALFFKRSHVESLEFMCTKERRCKVTFETKDQCHFCWLQRCYDVGMTLGEPSGFPEPCSVCGVWRDTVASHYGVMSCTKCSAFFFRCYSQYNPETFRCQKRDICQIGAGGCMYCTFHKCLLVGMEPIYRVKMSEEAVIAKEKFMRKSRSLVVKSIKTEPEAGHPEESKMDDVSDAPTNSSGVPQKSSQIPSSGPAIEFEPKKHLPKFLVQEKKNYEFKQQTMSEEKKRLRIRNTLSRIRTQLRGGRGDDDLFVQNMEQLNYYSSALEPAGRRVRDDAEDMPEVFSDDDSMAGDGEDFPRPKPKKRKLLDKSSKFLWSPQMHGMDEPNSTPLKHKKKKKRRTEPGLPTADGISQEGNMETDSDLESDGDLGSDGNLEDSSSSVGSLSGDYVPPGPVECPVCTLPYASYAGLAKHAYDVHLASCRSKTKTWVSSADIWFCDPCGKKFNRNDISFDVHFDQVHRSQFVCPLCDHKFLLIEKLHEHLKKFHAVAKGSPLLKHIQPVDESGRPTSKSASATSQQETAIVKAEPARHNPPAKPAPVIDIWNGITPKQLCHVCGAGMSTMEELREHCISSHSMEDMSSSNTTPTLLDELLSSMFSFGPTTGKTQGEEAGNQINDDHDNRSNSMRSSPAISETHSMDNSSAVTDYPANPYTYPPPGAHLSNSENPYTSQAERYAAYPSLAAVDSAGHDLSMHALTADSAAHRFVSEVLRMVDNAGSVLCEICGEIVEEDDNSMSRMLGHQHMEHGMSQANGWVSKDYPCSLCDFVFPKLNMLESHILAHPPVSEHIICDMCQDSGWFDTMSAARAHMLKVHLAQFKPGGRPPKKVPKTPRRRKAKTAVAKYQCEHCDEAFENKHEVTVHVQFAHINPQFKCPKCNFIAHSEGEKEYHMQTLHAGRSNANQFELAQTVPSQDLVNFYAYDNLQKNTHNETASEFSPGQNYGLNKNPRSEVLSQVAPEEPRGGLSKVPYGEQMKERRDALLSAKSDFMTKSSIEKEYRMQDMPDANAKKDWSVFCAYRNLPEFPQAESEAPPSSSYRECSGEYRKSLHCPHCNFVGISEGEREYHMKVMHPTTRPSYDNIPNRDIESYGAYPGSIPQNALPEAQATASSLSYMEMMKEDRQVLQCPECGYVATCEGGWVYHMQVVHPNISRPPIPAVINQQRQDNCGAYPYSSRSETSSIADTRSGEEVAKQRVHCAKCSFAAETDTELVYHMQVVHCVSTNVSLANIPSQSHGSFPSTSLKTTSHESALASRETAHLLKKYSESVPSSEIEREIRARFMQPTNSSEPGQGQSQGHPSSDVQYGNSNKGQHSDGMSLLAAASASSLLKERRESVQSSECSFSTSEEGSDIHMRDMYPDMRSSSVEPVPGQSREGPVVPDDSSHQNARIERVSRGKKRIVDDNEEKFCKLCQKSVPALLYKEHMKEHRGQKQQYACSHCVMTYTIRYSRDLHELVTHMKMLPYPCERCPEKFASMNALLKHTKILHPKSAVTVSYSLHHMQQYIGLGSYQR